MSKIVCFFLGTRPEAIKFAPLIRLLQSPQSGFEVRVVLTGQRPLAAQNLREFNIEANEELPCFLPGQSLSELTSKIVFQAGGYLKSLRLQRTDPQAKPIVMVHGNTQSSVAAALAACGPRSRGFDSSTRAAVSEA